MDPCWSWQVGAKSYTCTHCQKMPPSLNQESISHSGGRLQQQPYNNKFLLNTYTPNNQLFFHDKHFTFQIPQKFTKHQTTKINNNEKKNTNRKKNAQTTFAQSSTHSTINNNNKHTSNHPTTTTTTTTTRLTLLIIFHWSYEASIQRQNHMLRHWRQRW